MIDYEKLLERCIQEWLDNEGCCWRPDESDSSLDIEEIRAVQEIVDRLSQ